MSMVNEAAQVDGWRWKRFLQMGFTPEQVELLVAWGASPGDVEPMIDHGCPPDTAMSIMRPLEDPPVLPLLRDAEQYAVKV